MEPITKFYIVHHSIEALFSVLILFSTYYAIKRFKLVIWRKGWYLIGLGAFIFIVVELLELLEITAYLEKSVQLTILMHIIHIAAFPLIAIGIFLLARSAVKIWGK